jgi:hypothetical protein
VNKRSQKMYEYKAIVSNIQSRLAIQVGHNPLRLASKDMERVSKLAKDAYDALENLHCELESMIENETGYTTQYAKATGGSNE